MAEIINGNPNAGQQNPVDITNGQEIEKLNPASEVQNKIDKLRGTISKISYGFNEDGGITVHGKKGSFSFNPPHDEWEVVIADDTTIQIQWMLDGHKYYVVYTEGENGLELTGTNIPGLYP